MARIWPDIFHKDRQSGMSLVETITAVGVLGIVVLAANEGLQAAFSAKSRMAVDDNSSIYKQLFHGVAAKTVNDIFTTDPCVTSGKLNDYLKSNAVMATFRKNASSGTRIALVDYQMPAGEEFTTLATSVNAWSPVRSRCSSGPARTSGCLTIQEQNLSGGKIRNLGFVESRYLVIDVAKNTRDFRFGNQNGQGNGPRLEALPATADCYDAKNELGVSAQISYVVYSAAKIETETAFSQDGGVAAYLANDKVADRLTIEPSPTGNQSPYAMCGWRCKILPLEPMPVVDIQKQKLDTEPYKKDASGNVLMQDVTTTVTEPDGSTTTVTTQEPIPNPTYNQMVNNPKYGHLVEGMNDEYLAYHAEWTHAGKVPFKLSGKRWTRMAAPCNGNGTYNDPVCPKWPIGGEGDWACPGGYSTYSCNGTTGIGCNISRPGDCRRPDTVR